MVDEKVVVEARVRLDAYRIIDDVVEQAVRLGYNRVYKHTDNPQEDLFIQEIHRAVMNELCEVLKFDDEG